MSPPITLDGATEKPLRTAALIVNPAVLVVAPRVADIVSTSVVSTPVVSTENVAEVAPLGTVTVGGTDAPALSEARLMLVPPTGAGAESVTVPVEELPP